MLLRFPNKMSHKIFFAMKFNLEKLNIDWLNQWIFSFGSLELNLLITRKPRL